MESNFFPSNDHLLWKKMPTTDNDEPPVRFCSTNQNSYCIKHLVPKDNDNGIYYPNCNDVLSGRGGLINKHSGNVSFRRLIERNKSTYHTCQKEFKSLLAKSIVLAFHQSSPPGRFLVKDDASGLWYNIGTRKAIAKTRQALREGAPEIRMMMDRNIGANDTDTKQPDLLTQLQFTDRKGNETYPPDRNSTITTFPHGHTQECSIFRPSDSEDDQDIFHRRFVLIENDEIDNIDILNSFHDDVFDEDFLLVTQQQDTEIVTPIHTTKALR